MTFGQKLKHIRTNNNLTQSELAKIINCKNTSISNWEKDTNKPDIETLARICNTFHVSASYFIEDFSNDTKHLYSKQENEHIKKYLALDDHGKKIVDTVTDIELERMNTSNNIVEFKPETIDLPIYDDKVSAGGGYMFNDNGAEIITVIKNRTTERADFVLTVSGASMEPEFYDGDKILVRKQPDVCIGEIGIFTVNECGYIKKKGSNRLISINKEYKDIYITENDYFACNGLVIGKLDEEDIIE